MTLYSYLITLHYIALHFLLLVGLRTVYLINLKNLICVDIVKSQVKFYLLLDSLHIILFVTILASTGWPPEISRRAAGWTALVYGRPTQFYPVMPFISNISSVD